MADIALRDDIIKLTEQNARGQKLVSFSALVLLLTTERISRILQQHAIIPFYRASEYVKLIQKDYPKIFSILVLIGRVSFVATSFIHLDLTDAKLPLTEEQLQNLPKSVCNGFRVEQHAFLALPLRLGLIHKVLDAKVVLPFLEEEELENGEGAYGKVYKFKVHQAYQELEDPQQSGKKGETWFVRKEMKKISERASAFETERNALELLMQVRCDNVIQLLMTYVHGDSYNLIFPFADSDLRMYLRDAANVPTSLEQKIHLWAQVRNLASALVIIHQNTLKDGALSHSYIGYHHDLKPQNILISNGTFKIADLGLARFKFGKTDSKTSLRWGTNLYGPPESYKRDGSNLPIISRKFDVWSLGCIISEIVTFTLLGPEGLFDFSEARTTTNSLTNSEDDWYHDMKTLKPEVHHWFDHLKTFAPTDTFTSKMLDLVISMLRSDPTERPDSALVAAELTRLVQLLESAHLDGLQIRQQEQDSKTLSHRKTTTICQALSEGNDSLVHALLNEDACRFRDERGNSLLHHAVAIDNADMVNTILNSSAGLLSNENIVGRTAFHTVAVKNSRRALECLLSGQSDINDLLLKADIYGGTPLHVAAKSGNAEIFDQMMKGLDYKHVSLMTVLRERDNVGMQVLHRAATGGHLAVVERILFWSKKVPCCTEIILREPDDFMRTPVALAEKKRHFKVLEILGKAFQTSTASNDGG